MQPNGEENVTRGNQESGLNDYVGVTEAGNELTTTLMMQESEIPTGIFSGIPPANPCWNFPCQKCLKELPEESLGGISRGILGRIREEVPVGIIRRIPEGVSARTLCRNFRRST